MAQLEISGQKKSGGGSSSTGAKEAPNTLQSTATARLVEIISHGECVGLADGTNPLKSVYLDGTAVQNSDGTFNYSGMTLEQRQGFPSQAPFTGFSEVESEVAIGLAITVPLPRTYTITNNFIDAVRLRIQIDALTQQNTTTGDLTGSAVSYKFERRVGSGSWELVFIEQLNDKCTSAQQLSYRINRPVSATDTDDWSVRVTRLTADSTVVTIQNSISLVAATEITDSNLQYADLAGVGITVDSKQFGSSIPVRSYDFIGLVLDVPSNYAAPDPLDPINPAGRTYSGLWDGTFKRAWTDNPAWVLWAMLTDREWGLGKLIEPSQVDKWGLYQIAQYCDAFISDGRGGTEPRYRINTQITSSESAYAMLQSIASIFRGMMYWGTGSVAFVADQPRDSIRLMSPSNVLNGEFNYAGAALKARHSVALVTWNNPSDRFQTAIEVVEDPEMIERFGWRPTSVAAVGCISESQAHRTGRWILDTERHESETVSYQAGFDNADLRPGEIIDVFDPAYAGARYAGRATETSSSTQVTVDSPILIETGKSYTIGLITADGLLVERALTNPLNNTLQSVLTWTVAVDEVPVAGSTALVFSDNLSGALQRGQIRSITTTSVTFEIAVALNSADPYNISFTLPNGSVVTRSVDVSGVTGGTQIGSSNNYELLTLSWASALGTLPHVGTYAFVAPPGEGFSAFVLNANAGPTSCGLTASATFLTGYTYRVQLTRPDGVIVTRPLTNSVGTSSTLTWASSIQQLPVVGSMWGVTVSDLAPRKFRVTDIVESQVGIFTITALSYDSAKYARIESSVYLPPVVTTVFGLTDVPAPPTNVSAGRFPTLQTDGTYIDYVQLSWTPSVSPFVNKYHVSYQYNGGAWVSLPDAVANNARFVSQGPGSYVIHVVAVGMNGQESAPAIAGWTLLNERPFDGAVISNIRVENDLGATTVGGVIHFTTQDLAIAWDVLPPATWPDQTITNWVDPYLLHYDVTLKNLSLSTTYASYTPNQQRMTITADDIVQSTGGNVRDFKISIAMVDAYGTYTPAVKEFLNAAPAVPTGITLTQTARGFTISCNLPTELDVIGTLVWVSTSNGFDPTVVSPTFDGPQTNFSYAGTTGTTYYVRVAHYDLYSKVASGLNISTQSSITIGVLGAGDIDPLLLLDSVIVTASQNLAAGDLVNIWNSSGAKVRKADGSTTGQDAHGYVIAAVTSGNPATVYLEGPNTHVTGLTPGTQFLSDSTAGLATATAPTTAGHVVQRVGFAASATSLVFERGDPITRA